MSDYLDPENEELLKDFFIEAESQVETMERTILAIEGNPEDREAIDELFRAAHTLKGGAATVQMMELAEFTHLVEDLLDAVRSDKVKISPDMVDALLDSIDIVKQMMEERMNGSVYEEDTSEIQAKLKSYQKGSSSPAPTAQSVAPVGSAPAPEESAASAEAPAPSASPNSAGLSDAELKEIQGQLNGEPLLKVRVHFDESNPMNTVGAIQVYSRLKDLGRVMGTSPGFDDIYGEMFFEYVDYYLATHKQINEIEKKSTLADVTLDIVVDEVSSEADTPSAEVQPSGESMAEATEASEDASDEGVTADKQQKKKAPAKKKDNVVGSILRVDSRRIDNMLNLVSEAVINKATFNQVSGHLSEVLTRLQTGNIALKEQMNNLFSDLAESFVKVARGDNPKMELNAIQERYLNLMTDLTPVEVTLKGVVSQFRNTAANLGRNTGDLHEAILHIRMVPIGQIFSRFPRLVRDLSRTLGKKVNLLMEGEDTELDKSVIEELLDPMMHCVRNSMDHGIESAEIREELGKPAEGTILLKASNEGNMIVIEITDDGGGIDVDRVKGKAIERGVIHPNKILSDIEAFNLIFDPGFSTAQKITNVSGRGVGLDVVKKQIEKLNGTVTVWSAIGEGSKFTIKLPLTLAIIQGLLVKVGTEVYAIPITSVAESIRITTNEIKKIDNYEVINIRDDVISLLRLSSLFQLKSTTEDSEFRFVVIVGSDDKRIGLMVDALIGEEDVVIKPLTDRYTHSPGIAGATILGDGNVSLILDVSQLLELGVQYERYVRKNRFVS